MRQDLKRNQSLFTRPLVLAVTIALAASGAGSLVGSFGTDYESVVTGTSPEVVVVESSSTSILATETTQTTAKPSAAWDDFTLVVLDTSNREIVEAAWKRLESRPRHRMNWTGSVSACRAGDTDPQFKTDVLRRVQWFRAMAGVSPGIELDNGVSALAQHAALVMAANGDLTHEPDSSWRCFSDEAFEGASKSNLSLGDFGVESIDGYMEDPGADNLPVGHRRWILDPTLLVIGTGDTRNTNALFVINDRVNEEATTREPDGFIMWPPRGFVPRKQIYPRWSVSHRTADFSRATVVINHGGKTKTFSNPYNDNDGYGMQNSLVFEWRRPERGSGPVRVVVRNILVNGEPKNLEYQVEPFD